MQKSEVQVGRPRSERSHRAILDTAARLLRERGYADITIEGIAAEAGVGKATIYRRWSTKASLYMELYAELAAKIVPPVAEQGGRASASTNEASFADSAVTATGLEPAPGGPAPRSAFRCRA